MKLVSCVGFTFTASLKRASSFPFFVLVWIVVLSIFFFYTLRWRVGVEWSGEKGVYGANSAWNQQPAENTCPVTLTLCWTVGCIVCSKCFLPPPKKKEMTTKVLYTFLFFLMPPWPIEASWKQRSDCRTTKKRHSSASVWRKNDITRSSFTARHL